MRSLIPGSPRDLSAIAATLSEMGNIGTLLTTPKLSLHTAGHVAAVSSYLNQKLIAQFPSHDDLIELLQAALIQDLSNPNVYLETDFISPG